MKVKDPHFILEKIEKYIAEDIRPSRVRESVQITDWKYLETDMDDRIDDAYQVDYDDGNWQEFRLWDTWGGYDKSAWFRTTVEIPDRLRGKRLALFLQPGPRDGGGSTAEGLLYVNGTAVQAVDIWHDEVILEDALCRETRLVLALKVWSGVLDVPKFRTFKEAELRCLDMEVDRFCFTVDTIRRCALLLDENDLRRICLTRLLNNTFKRVDFLNYPEEDYYRSVYEALDFLEKGLEELAKTTEIKPDVCGVGHSHIDMAWLWRLNATREKASRTFATVLNLMKQYPEYRFMHSSPQLYKFLKEDYPEIFARVKEKINEGQWEITGGMWVESDTNVPSGESLVRQFIYGKRYIREEFGKETKLLWLPDVFGYSAALPQIMKKCGMKYFMTTKISWNQYNHFPYDTFLWKGIDGSEILTHFITTPEDGSWYYTYNGHMDPEEVVGVWNNYKNKDKNDELLIAYGWGDGGGGPTREMLEQSRVMKNVPGIPRVRMSGAEEYFERLYQNVDQEGLNRWEGELYFELHRGTYTSQAANKRYNRKSEILLHDIEFLAALGTVASKDAIYPKEELDRIWERVLLNQFHDILPGSSIRQVYEDTTADYEVIAKKGAELLDAAKKNLAKTVRVCADSVICYNTAGYMRSGYVLVPFAEGITADTGFRDESGALDCAKTKDGILAYVTNIPAYGYKTIQICEKNTSAGDGVIVTDRVAESPYWHMEFNENGEISVLYDKKNHRQVSCGKAMNVFAAFEDKPQRFDAWDVDVYYKEKPYDSFVLQERQVLEQGERAVIRQVYRFNKSLLTQDVILYAKNPRIDFKTCVDWKEKQVFLKTYFPVDVHAAEASYEIQFGSIKRPTHSNTEWDFARFEVPGHRWVDLSEGGYGVALLNDCKYGYDVQENVLGLSLIKSAIRPDETADRKIHHFTYSLYPHAGMLEESDVQKEAVNLNMPVLTGMVKGSDEAEDGFASYGLVSCSSGHVLIDTVKQSEDGKALTIRVYEYQNKKENGCTLVFHAPVSKACECNLCEEEETPVDLKENKVSFTISCFEVKTFKVYIG